jgi:two-component system LytT family response regulator
MKVIIIEDEKPAAEKLHKALLACDATIQVQAVLSSVKSAVEWLQQNAGPDLVFMDIELTDGLSFKIFDQVSINCPVIFTTAYDEYWQEAFEHNSIDYLLKPLKQEKLQLALKKYQGLKQHFNYQQLLTQQGEHKKRFLVKRGTDYISIKTTDISYFYAAQKLVCLVDNNAQKFILDQSLSDLEKQLDPAQFYRVNRKYLVNLNAIKRIKAYAKSKLQLEIQPAPSEEIIISQENAAAFKAWMEQ